jgi:uncharacterized protein YbcV (DUF1398 family)
MFRKTVTNFHFLPPVYKSYVAWKIFNLPAVQTSVLRNADNLITISSVETIKKIVKKKKNYY